MNNLESAAATIATIAPYPVTVNGFLDGAALLTILPSGWDWSEELVPLQTLMANLTAFANPVFPSYCAELYGADTWKCLVGELRMPLITSPPFFINAPMYDMFNIMCAYISYSSLGSLLRVFGCLTQRADDTDNYAPQSPSQMAFVNSFQTGVRALISTLPSGTGVFAPSCLVHCLSGQSTFSQLTLTTSSTATPVSLDSTLAAWYFTGPQDASALAVSSCTGWDCINACGVDLWTGLPCNMGTTNCTALQLSTDPGATTTSDRTDADEGVSSVVATVTTAALPPPPSGTSDSESSDDGRGLVLTDVAGGGLVRVQAAPGPAPLMSSEQVQTPPATILWAGDWQQQQNAGAAAAVATGVVPADGAAAVGGTGLVSATEPALTADQQNKLGALNGGFSFRGSTYRRLTAVVYYSGCCVSHQEV